MLFIAGTKGETTTAGTGTFYCPNCHAMVHKNKNHTLSLNELKELLK